MNDSCPICFEDVEAKVLYKCKHWICLDCYNNIYPKHYFCCICNKCTLVFELVTKKNTQNYMFSYLNRKN